MISLNFFQCLLVKGWKSLFSKKNHQWMKNHRNGKIESNAHDNTRCWLVNVGFDNLLSHALTIIQIEPKVKVHFFRFSNFWFFSRPGNWRRVHGLWRQKSGTYSDNLSENLFFYQIVSKQDFAVLILRRPIFLWKPISSDVPDRPLSTNWSSSSTFLPKSGFLDHPDKSVRLHTDVDKHLFS